MTKIRMHIPSGRRYVHCAYAVYRSSLAAIVEIDMRLKRADVECVGISSVDYDMDACCLWFTNSDDSFFKGKKIKRAHGEIYFPEFGVRNGWSIHSACRTGRYTLGVTFIRQETPSTGAA